MNKNNSDLIKLFEEGVYAGGEGFNAFISAFGGIIIFGKAALHWVTEK